ncbi:hypothetical protein C0992_006583 [Termitomyces sp. T32_za158]|nr:hypothetical protein C0992_006583 [Termitomyces sp. T32_za158]
MSLPPSSSSSALPSPSRRTAPVSSRSAARVVFGPGQIQAVPEASRVSTANVPPVVWTQALQRARGPPTLAWCQANGPCSHCVRRNADSVFEGPQAGSRRDSAVCEACRENHERCSVAWLWQVCCVSAEQGWDLDWVWRKTGKEPRPRVVEVPGGGPTAVEGVPTPVGTPCLRPDKGKRKAVSKSEAPKRVRRRLSPAPPVFEGGPSGSNVFSPGSGRLLPSITIRQGPLEISQAEERDEAAQARDMLLRDHDASLELLEAQAEEVEQLRAQLMREAAGSSTGALGFVALSAQEVEAMARGLRWADESESRRRDWLLREVAAARLETLGWAWEHRLLLDGLSSGVSYMVEELAEQATTPRVAQGAGHLSRLMEAHRHRSFVETAVWLEAFVDGLQTPPSLEEIVRATRESMEAEFGPGGGQGELQEGQKGGD